MSNEGMFYERFKSERARDWYQAYKYNIYSELVIQFGIKIIWPPDISGDPPPIDDMFDMVEFFYQYCSKFNKSLYGGSTFYNREEGKLEYEYEMNQLLERFHLPYLFAEGEIRHASSKVLDEYIWNFELKTNDEELNRLIKGSLDKF